MSDLKHPAQSDDRRGNITQKLVTVGKGLQVCGDFLVLRPVGMLVTPLTAEAAGLSFHRASMLAIIHKVTGHTALRDNCAMLIRFHAGRPLR